MAKVDNAGVFVQRFDQSLIAAQVQPDALFAASAVEAERGFINQPILFSDVPSFRGTYFVSGKDHRRFGTSSHEIEIYLGSQNPIYVSRGGDATWLISSLRIDQGTIAAFVGSGQVYEINDVVTDGGDFFKAIVQVSPTPATGNVNLISNAIDGDTVTLSDGVNSPITFEFDDDVSVGAGNVLVTIAATASDTMTNFIAAVQGEITSLNLLMTVSGGIGDSADLTNPLQGALGNVAITESTGGTVIGITGMTGGVDIPVPIDGATWQEITEDEAELLVPVVPVQETGVLQGNVDLFTDPDQIARFFAKGEGDWGNRIELEGVASTASFENVSTAALTDIRVYFDGDLAETFTVSRRPTDFDAGGRTLYFPDVFSRDSQFTSASDNFVAINDQQQMIFARTFMNGGSTLTKPTSAQMNTALTTILGFPETFDVFVAINGESLIDYPDFSATVITNDNCYGITGVIEADNSDDPTTLVAKRSTTYNGSDFRVSGAITPWVRVTESESGEKIFISPAGHKASNIARQFNNGQLFFAPAGNRRGSLIGVDALTIIFSGADRVVLVASQFNPIKQDKTGIFFWDTLTSQTFLSSFSNEHVTISFLALKRAIEDSLASFVFEFNDQDTVDSILVILNDIGAQLILDKGLNDFEVHDSNNVLGSSEMTIDFVAQFKGVAKKITVRVTAIPATGDISTALS